MKPIANIRYFYYLNIFYRDDLIREYIMSIIEQKKEVTTKTSSKEKDLFSAPSLSLPKGGGAIRGMGEKFAANPVTGTGSMTVPIFTSPGRSGFGPQLSLSYDSGSGNGPFGFGWSLSLPSITRKTDKGLPQYRDAEESDVFILSGSEDLVPVLKGKNLFDEKKCDEDGNLVADTEETYAYLVRKYRPRIEGLFARIERWQHKSGEVHWRSISKDNILTLYGKYDNSRISDPNDKTRVFSWLIFETRDDKGNAILYEYKEENNDGVDLTQAHEQNRGDSKGTQRTTNRYIKKIYYGNKNSLLSPKDGKRPNFIDLDIKTINKFDWMFEVVFDYGEHNIKNPKPNDADIWPYRKDPFSNYRAGFEIRTYRICKRVLMFHHFPDEDIRVDCLVRSTDFSYSDVKNPIYTFMNSVTQTGYRRSHYEANSTEEYIDRSFPPVEFEYSKPIVQDKIEKRNAPSLENLPQGIDGNKYQWVDLHGEGMSGILTEQAGAWFYKRNLSPVSENTVNFAALEQVDIKPNLALAGGHAQFMDLAGDGQLDLVVLDEPTPGFYEHDENEGWQLFRSFSSKLNRNMHDPNLKFIDLNGDGHADVLISEDNVFTSHASLAEEGFGPAQCVNQSLDEEKGPRIVFADGTQSIYLSDLSGDGLTDIVRIRNGDICYWPNLGYGKFGAKVTMDNAPFFDNPDQFDQKRIRLADIDGSGTTDILYLHRDGVRLYFNQSGNSWSAPDILQVFPRIDDSVNITPIDLFGNGTCCLVWSSPLPGDEQEAMRFVNLMGEQKPHLLIKTVNNLGAETTIKYASSTKFYLQDKLNGNPWITKLPFPVHVVERIETYDRISRNHFVTRYAYHHGYFDSIEREFRGFGMVEQWDTEAFTVFHDTTKNLPSNIDASSYVPPIYTKTWFHTGVYIGRDNISNFFAGANTNKRDKYYCEPGWEKDSETNKYFLDDTVMPSGILQKDGTYISHAFTFEEEREACRALKGTMLRQEVYALDETNKTDHPYIVTEQNFGIECLQPQLSNKHAVFFIHNRESISYHYERNSTDPRITHNLTLNVDIYGNVLRSASIAYGRRQEDTNLTNNNKTEQTKLYITFSENNFTTTEIDDASAWRTPLPSEVRTFELTGFLLPKDSINLELTEFLLPKDGIRFNWDEMYGVLNKATEFAYETKANEIKSNLQSKLQEELQKKRESEPSSRSEKKLYAKRLIEHVRTLYRSNDFTRALELRELQSLARPYETYKLAYTPRMVDEIFKSRITDDMLQNKCCYVHGEINVIMGKGWWIPSGRIFYSPNINDSAEEELAYAQKNFFLPRRYRTPFHTEQIKTETIVVYDDYNLLLQEVRDPLDNIVTVGERILDPLNPHNYNILKGNDYRVLQPYLLMDANRNLTKVVFDALGLVVGTAAMGKPEDDSRQGDIIDDNFNLDLSETEISAHLQDPLADPNAILKQATSRLIYDLLAYKNSKGNGDPKPAVVYTLVRETHVADLTAGQQTLMQHQFSYSDGFGREVQKKIQAERGPVPKRDNTGHIITNNGQPEMTADPISPRWVGSGWTIFNNKGKPVRQYEPFFTDRHTFEFEPLIGVSPVIFYDPLERIIATLHPNHTWEKVSFDAWQQKTWDVNDTVRLDPHADDEIQGYMKTYFTLHPDWKSWLQQRIPNLQNLPNDTKGQNSEQDAALRSLAHADTPSRTYFDSLGRNFLTLADNGKDANGNKLQYYTRVIFDIEGKELEVIDAKGQQVIRYDYDMLGNRIHQVSMEAGERWMLNDVSGKPIYSWDSRGHRFHTEYDQLRRPLKQFVMATNDNLAANANPDPRIIHADFNGELLIDFFEYGEGAADDIKFNLRTRVVQHKDAAGIVTNGAYDFKGNLLKSSRQIAEEYKKILNWASSVDLEEVLYNASTVYDALNRPISLTSPDNSTVIPHYNEANLLDKLDVNLRGEKDSNGLVWTHFVTNIDYNAKGQRTLIQYGNEAETLYRYDFNTFRLIQLYTRRRAAFTEDCGNESPPPRTAAPIEPPVNKTCGLQNLFYTYDPAGNITNIRDMAQQRTYFRNQIVDANNDYYYDALYRLISATGREHLGQSSPIQHSYNDALRINQAQPNDENAMGRYIETYQYDEVGNFIDMKHQGLGKGNPSSWSRFYEYLEASLLESNNVSNRLSRTTLNSNATQPTLEQYVYDAHGNMVSMPQLQVMEWDFNNRLIVTQRQAVNENTEDIEEIQRQGERTYYVYDSSGQRVRKVTELAASTTDNPLIKDERIYSGGFEVYKRHGSNAITRETLHIMDDKQRIGIVETRTEGNEERIPARLIRYQFSNHLGSASLELDDKADIISYEEYTPYGSTSYQAVRSQTEVSKRYRYTGKERDEESGLYYHGARYYASWLGRWTATDPAGIDISTSMYIYVNGNPIKLTDNTGEMPDGPVTDEFVRRLGTTIYNLPPQRIENNRQRFRNIAGEQTNTGLKSKNPENKGKDIYKVKDAANTLITAFKDPLITDRKSTVSSRLDSIIEIAQSDDFLGRIIMTFRKDTISGTGDTGFRKEFQDLTMHPGSGDQIGHFLGAVRAAHEFPQYMAWHGMLGHELENDRHSGLLKLVNGQLSVSEKDLTNFREGKLDLIPLDTKQFGVSYEDLYLTYFGLKFGEMVDQGKFANNEEASEFLKLLLTPMNLDELPQNDFSKKFATKIVEIKKMLAQFEETQTDEHTIWRESELKK